MTESRRDTADSLYSIPVARIDGRAATLGEYRGKVLLVVNVASKCGLTPRYEALQRLYVEKRGRGLEILGFPANDFGRQEPGTESEIAAFCTTNYGVTFPMFRKITVVGPERHPLYNALAAARPHYQGSSKSAPDITWNFEKFVVGRDGAVVGRFKPEITPDDPRLVAALEDALAARA